MAGIAKRSQSETVKAVPKDKHGNAIPPHKDTAWYESLKEIDPHVPTDTAPGSHDKVRTLAARYAAQVPLWDDRDRVDTERLAANSRIRDPLGMGGNRGRVAEVADTESPLEFDDDIPDECDDADE